MREKVKNGAMWFVYSMHELIDVLKEDESDQKIPVSPTIKTPVHTNGLNWVNGIQSNGHSNGITNGTTDH